MCASITRQLQSSVQLVKYSTQQRDNASKMSPNAVSSRCRVLYFVAAFDCQSRKNGMYADGCSPYFWWCWAGRASKHACVTGLFFDGDHGECTYRSWTPA